MPSPEVQRNGHENTTEASPWREWLPVGLLCLLAALLRLWAIGRQSLWQDELIWADWAKQATLQEVVHAVAFPHSPFFCFFLQPFPALIANDTFVRLPAALFGILNIPVLYLLGRQLFSRLAGLGAAIVLTLAPLHISLSRQVEPYTLQVLSITLFALALLRAWEDNRYRYWLGVTLAAVASMYAHIYSVFPLGMMAGALCLDWILRYRCWRRMALLVLAMGSAAILYLPWLLWHPADSTFRLDVHFPFFPEALMRPSVLLSLAGALWRDANLLNAMVPPWAPFAFLPVMAMALWAGMAHRRSLLFTMCLLMSIIGPVAASWHFGYFVNGRYMMGFLLALALLGGLALEGLVRSCTSCRNRFFLVPMAGLLCFGTLFVWNLSVVAEIHTGPTFQNFRGLLGWMQHNVQEEDAVFTMAKYAPNYPFARYAPGLESRVTFLPRADWQGVSDALARGKKVWIFSPSNIPPKRCSGLREEGYPQMFLHTAQPLACVLLVWPDKQMPAEKRVDLERSLLQDALSYNSNNLASLFMQLGEIAQQAPVDAHSAAWYWEEAAHRLEWHRRITPFSREIRGDLAVCYEKLGRYFEAAHEYRFLLQTTLEWDGPFRDSLQECLEKQAAAALK